MSPELFRHLDECRRKGLVVGEEFERHGSPRELLRTAMIALFTILLSLALATLIKPHLTRSVRTPPSVPAGERPSTSRSRSPLHPIVRVQKANT